MDTYTKMSNKSFHDLFPVLDKLTELRVFTTEEMDDLRRYLRDDQCNLSERAKWVYDTTIEDTPSTDLNEDELERVFILMVEFNTYMKPLVNDGRIDEYDFERVMRVYTQVVDRYNLPLVANTSEYIGYFMDNSPLADNSSY